MSVSQAARGALARMVEHPASSPVRILGAAVAFLRECASTPFERQLSDKVDALIVAEIRRAQGLEPVREPVIKVDREITGEP